MAVHCSSNVILLAIEYFIDLKGERARKTKYKTFINLKQLFTFVWLEKASNFLHFV